MTPKIFAYVLATIAVLLLAISCIMPPAGVIDPSVIQAVGEIAGIIAIFFVWDSVEKGLSAKVKHNNTELEFTKKD